MSTKTRTLEVGSLVRIGGGTVLWEVTRVGEFFDIGTENPVRCVDLRSQASGTRRVGLAADKLKWPGGGYVDPRPGRDRRDQEPQEPEERPPWGSDGCSAAVIEWEGPINSDGTVDGPSAVSVCRYHDSRGNLFVGVVSDGDGEERAFLRVDTARELALAILDQTREM